MFGPYWKAGGIFPKSGSHYLALDTQTHTNTRVRKTKLQNGQQLIENFKYERADKIRTKIYLAWCTKFTARHCTMGFFKKRVQHTRENNSANKCESLA